jgi:aspartate kinase
MIVCKFGGTSVGDAAAIRRLAGIILARVAQRPVVVVSALAGVTNALLHLLALAEGGDEAGLARALEAIVGRHSAIARELGITDGQTNAIVAEAERVRALLVDREGIPPTEELTDFVAGWGELWSSRLVAAALQAAGVPAEWVDVRRALLTDARFTRAQPDRAALAERAPRLFGPLLEAGRVPVTQGFIGAVPDGRPTTLGRGGSDFTAALLGAALQAERVEIWTDVDGIMTADPRIVANARPLPTASHLEAAELAAFGATVLHPATQAPLVEARIPCVVLNSFAPERPGTTIISGHRPAPVGNSPVRSISCKRGITVVNVRSPASLGSVGFMRALSEILERHGLVVDVIATSEVNVSVTVDDPARLDEARGDLEGLGEVTVFPHRAIVAVVGIGLRGTKGLAARIFTAVRGINIEVISQGASEINVTFVVREEEAAEAVRCLHHALIEEAA